VTAVTDNLDELLQSRKPLHPLCELFPPIEGMAFDKLVASIREDGLQEPITVIGDDEAILDGRNRYNACLAAGVDPVFVPFRGDDPVRFVIAANLTRRHLTDSQRAMLAARLATRELGSNQHRKEKEGASIDAPSQAKAAELLSVSRSSVQRAREVLERAEPVDVVAITKGEATVSGIAKKLKAAEEKKQRRAARESELAAKQHALPDKKYGVIYADPEWRFEPYSRETGMDRAADNHYPTSELKVILNRPIWNITAKDCALFLWATVPMLPQALEVMDAWGFTYKSNFVWMKDRIGTGYWNRNQHELLLVGTRGNVPAPAPGEQWPSAIQAAVEAHSVKPERFIELIESYYPTLPKIELNRRGPARAGWDAWGNEAPAPMVEPVAVTEIIPPKAKDLQPRKSAVAPPDDDLDIPAAFRRKRPTEARADGPAEQP
jgi:N6-adenosine-specific RNA methylase IME4/ParB-like chromosome segregation protein Spo0J